MKPTPSFSGEPYYSGDPPPNPATPSFSGNKTGGAVLLLLAGCFYFGYFKKKKAGSSSALLKNAQVQLVPDQGRNGSLVRGSESSGGAVAGALPGSVVAYGGTQYIRRERGSSEREGDGGEQRHVYRPFISLANTPFFVCLMMMMLLTVVIILRRFLFFPITPHNSSFLLIFF
ncbi:uncharacterized protein LOC110903975 [Helianthus annuus]|uniref:uncharacterized protein LOC110903975 n=1 Tax=Helianthus annuus TaxID=4232 RepID=UPI000B8FF2EE|nr:uncharacterized protein LOC110903975 [Helianthus annuus]